MYLLIENKGECPIEGFTVLGLSTARDNQESIGQFGSGNKHGMLLCMRAGINPVVFCGTHSLEFFTKPKKMGEKDYAQVYCKVDGQSPRELSMCLEFGALDWDNLAMALREFVSNAIDASASTNDVRLDIVSETKSKNGYTRVYIPLTPEVQRFYNELNQWFLHFDDKNETGVIEKESISPVRIYRKGVFVRTLETKESVFDYNFGNELKIDEARTLDDYTVSTAMSKVIGDMEDITPILAHFKSGRAIWEHDISHWWVRVKDADAWLENFNKNFPNHVIGPDGVQLLMANSLIATKKQFLPLNNAWFEVLKSAGFPVFSDILGNFTEDGHETLEPTPEAVETLDWVWHQLGSLGYTEGRKKPEVKCFRSVMKDGSTTLGFYKDGTVYFEVNETGNKKMALEEVGHYLTGAYDETRDFQDWAFNVATAALKLV
jgi:hypothetical protein